MNIIIARKEHNCDFNQCASFGKKVFPGQIGIRFLHWVKTEEGKKWKTIYFHPECWEQTQKQYVIDVQEKVKEKEEILVRRMARKSNRPQGRPRKYTDPMRARNLKQLLKYHQKAENTDKVREIERKIKELEVKE